MNVISLSEAKCILKKVNDHLKNMAIQNRLLDSWVKWPLNSSPIEYHSMDKGHTH